MNYQQLSGILLRTELQRQSTLSMTAWTERSPSPREDSWEAAPSPSLASRSTWTNAALQFKAFPLLLFKFYTPSAFTSSKVLLPRVSSLKRETELQRKHLVQKKGYNEAADNNNNIYDLSSYWVLTPFYDEGINTNILQVRKLRLREVKEPPQH